MWSGDTIVVNRKTAGSYQLHGAQLTFSAMTQSATFKSYMKTRGDDARGSGLWARFLVCNPSSNLGKRLLDSATVSHEHILRYAERVEELLVCSLDILNNPCKKRPDVAFTPTASELWMEVYNEIGYESGRMGGLIGREIWLKS